MQRDNILNKGIAQKGQVDHLFFGKDGIFYATKKGCYFWSFKDVEIKQLSLDTYLKMFFMSMSEINAQNIKFVNEAKNIFKRSIGEQTTFLRVAVESGKFTTETVATMQNKLKVLEMLQSHEEKII